MFIIISLIAWWKFTTSLLGVLAHCSFPTDVINSYIFGNECQNHASLRVYYPPVCLVADTPGEELIPKSVVKQTLKDNICMHCTRRTFKESSHLWRQNVSYLNSVMASASSSFLNFSPAVEIFESTGFKASKSLEDTHLNIYIFELRSLRVKYSSKIVLAADHVFRRRTKVFWFLVKC